MYAQVREKVGNATIPRERLADAVSTAEARLQGSNENIKVFRDILGKTDENEVELGGAAGGGVNIGHPLYDQLLASGVIEGAEDSQPARRLSKSYYSELGEKLSTGRLPGDVYQAMKSLQGNIGTMMDKMATEHGAGAQLSTARRFYRSYMETFREPTGPFRNQDLRSPTDIAGQRPNLAIDPLTSTRSTATLVSEAGGNPVSTSTVAGQGRGADRIRQFQARRHREYESTAEPEALAKALRAEPSAAPKYFRKLQPKPPIQWSPS